MDEFMRTIYDENPEFFPNGLSTLNFNGDDDKCFSVKDTKGNIKGFIGYQNRGNNTYISIGIDRTLRGNGNGKILGQKIINIAKSNHPDRKIIWTVNKKNIPSISLAKDLTNLDEVSII